MSGIFSGLATSDGPFNTVTSPDQEQAAATGNDQGPTPPPPDETPMAKIMAAVMRGAARVQGQEQAKDVVSKQAGNAGKVKLTMEANPDDPGNPRLTIHNITAEQLNGQEQANREKAFSQPQDQVEKALAPAVAQPAQGAPPAPQLPQDIPLDHVTTPPAGTDPHPIEIAARLIDASTGQHTPRPWEIDPEKLKSEDGIRSLIESDGWGDAARAAHATWRALQNGDTTPQAVARNIANKRLQNIHEQSLQIESTMAPIMADKKESLAENKEYALVRNQLLDQKNTMQYDTEDQYLQAVRNGMQVVGGIRPGDEKQFTSAFRSSKIDNMNARVKALSGPEGKAAIEAYQPNEGDKFLAEQFPQAKTPFEQNAALRIFNGLQDQKITRAIEEARKVGAIGAAATPEEAASGMGLDMATLKPGQRKTVAAAWQTANRDWKSKGLIEKATIQRLDEGNQLERMKIQQNAQQIADNQALIRLQTPEAVAQSVKAVLADGNQLYALPNKTPIERSFRDKVQAQVMAATGGRLPQQIKPGSEDDKRITVISQGIADTNKIEELYDKWLPVAPLGGPATEALNRAIIANKPSAYLANLAMQVVPGFSRLSPAKKDEYLSDAANMAHRVNALSIREARSTTGGGRMAVQIVDMFHGITPGFQNPATFKGLVTGARQEFANAENAIRSKQWSGQPPSAQAGSTATPSGPVVSDPDAIMNIFKKKP